MIIEFFVPGIPRPGGSKKAFAHSKTGRIMVVDAGGKHTKDWRSAVALRAAEAMAGKALLTGALKVSMDFYMPRPKCHYRTGKFSDKLKEGAPYYHTNKPDVGKLARSTEDAMTKIVYHDDSQIAIEYLEKFYEDNQTGVRITIIEVEK